MNDNLKFQIFWQITDVNIDIEFETVMITEALQPTAKVKMHFD